MFLDLEYSENVEVSSLNASQSAESVKVQPSSNESFVNFVAQAIQTGMLPIPILLERLEPDLLQSIGVIASTDLFNKKVVKINTSLFYRQQKFNLLREESEGFCRLIILISSTMNFNSSDSQCNVDLLYDRILETIGFFDLDPLRVLDIIFESFIFGLSAWRDYLKLLSKFSFPSASIVGIIGFKLAHIYSDQKFSPEYLEQVSTVIALMLNESFFKIEDIWGHLLPSDEGVLEEFEQFKQKIKETSKNLGVINLNSSSATNTSSATNNILSADSLTEQFAQDNLNTKLIPSLGFNRNLKAHLLLALLSIGSADLAYKIISSVPHLAVLNSKISKLICHVIEGIIDGNPENNSAFLLGKLAISKEETGTWSNWLNYLPTGGLFTCPTLFSKISVLLITESSDKRNILLQNHLIPALASSSADSLILSQELWNNYISTLPYPERYSIYGTWMDSFYSETLYGPLIRASSISEARKVMRRLAKENVRQYGRLVAKVTHSNPVVVLPLILDQLQAYDNIIPAVVDAFKYLPPLSFDVLIFCLLKSLCNPERDRLKEDGTNIASWLQNLSQFSAAIFRKYPQLIDPAPLLRYIYAQLMDDNCLDVLLLQEILIQMAGIDKPENASESLLEASSGGPILIQEFKSTNSQSLGIPTVSRRAQARLKLALESENLTFNLLVALAQASDAAIYRMDYSHLKLVSTLTDTCHSAFLQYLEFLKSLNVPVTFEFDKLVLVNKLELPIAFLIAKTFGLSIDSSPEVIKSVYSEEASSSLFIPSEFLKCFWSIGLSDISVPLHRYQAEIAKSKNFVEPLQQEMKQQVLECGRVRDSLVKVKDSWFTGSSDRNSIVNSVIKLALLPRILLGPTEALFSAKFLFLLHGLGPQRLSTLSLLDSIFDSLPSILLPSLTESESHCFGRFMHEILLVLQSWQTSREKYEREAISVHLPGFMKRWSHFLSNEASEEPEEPEESEEDGESVEDGEIETEIENLENSEIVTVAEEMSVVSLETEAEVNENALNWEDFKHVLYKWHEKLFTSVLGFLKSGEYSQIRNSIIFLSHLSGGTFPRLEKFSSELEAAVNELKQKESREDLKVLATRYSAMLTQNRGKLVKEHEFHKCESSEANVVDRPSSSLTASPEKKRPVQREREEENVAEKRVKLGSERDIRGDSRRDSRESKSRKDTSGGDNRGESRDNRDTRENRESRESRDTRESRESRDSRDTRDSRDNRRDYRSRDSREIRDERDNRTDSSHNNTRSSSSSSRNDYSRPSESRSSSRRYDDSGRSRRH